MIKLKIKKNKTSGWYDVLHYDDGQLIENKSKFNVGDRAGAYSESFDMKAKLIRQGKAVAIEE